MTPKQEKSVSLKIVWEKPVLLGKPTMFQVFESVLPIITNAFDNLTFINFRLPQKQVIMVEFDGLKT